MIFLYFLAISSGVRSQDSCEIEVPRNTGRCSDGFQYFYRTPKVKNHQTSGWCLKMITRSEPLSQKDAEMVCKQEGGAQVSMFDNLEEQLKIFDKTQIAKASSHFIRIDGHRKDKCESDHTSPECYRGNAFEMKSNHTDPTFQLNNFCPGDPNHLFPKPNEHVENCLVMMSPTGQLIDNSCLAEANYPQGPILSVLCGKLPF